MSKYKAVFSDLDGTLLDEEGKVRPSARAVVAQLRAGGDEKALYDALETSETAVRAMEEARGPQA